LDRRDRNGLKLANETGYAMIPFAIADAASSKQRPLIMNSARPPPFAQLNTPHPGCLVDASRTRWLQADRRRAGAVYTLAVERETRA
jgi:hypothetical protein